MGRRDRPGGQQSEGRVWQGSLGTTPTEYAASTICRSIEDCFRPALRLGGNAPAFAAPPIDAKSHCQRARQAWTVAAMSLCSDGGADGAAAPSWLRKSTTIHAAPVIAKFCALPAQLMILCGSANGAGSHTSNPKPMSIAVSERDARSAKRPESRAMA